MNAADPMMPKPFRIESVVAETPDTFTWTMRDEAGDRFAFAPGQFNMLYLFGIGEVAISISGDPADPGTLVHTIRAAGSVTNLMGKLAAGATVGVRGPFGTGWPMQQAVGGDLVLLCGGTGLAPLRPVLLEAMANRSRFGKVVLLYGARTPDQMLYRDELRQWAKRDIEVRVAAGIAKPGFEGHVGLVTELVDRADFEGPRTTAFLCGPEVMIRFAVRALSGRGVTEDRVWVSLERNMKCAIGFCGHCQFGASFLCRDGPVFRHDRVAPLLSIREV